MTARILPVVLDSTGTYAFSLESCSRTFTYATDGTKATDTANDGRFDYVKTYTSDGKGNVLTESGWVKQ